MGRFGEGSGTSTGRSDSLAGCSSEGAATIMGGGRSVRTAERMLSAGTEGGGGDEGSRGTPGSSGGVEPTGITGAGKMLSL